LLINAKIETFSNKTKNPGGNQGFKRNLKEKHETKNSVLQYQLHIFVRLKQKKVSQYELLPLNLQKLENFIIFIINTFSFL
jgi:hypothetical protein